MSKAEIERFGEAVRSDSALTEEVKAAGADPAAIAALAQKKGYDFTADELKELAEEKKGQLTEEELDQAAGGGWVYKINYLAVS